MECSYIYYTKFLHGSAIYPGQLQTIWNGQDIRPKLVALYNKYKNFMQLAGNENLEYKVFRTQMLKDP